LEVEEIANMQRPKRTRKMTTILSFDLKPQYIHCNDSRIQAKLDLTKSYAVEVTEPNTPQLGEGEYPGLYFPTPTNIMHIHMLRYKDPNNKSGWIKALKKELNTIIDIGTLNNK
jgi:hypothetical protein